MKPASVYYGEASEKVTEKFAWLPKRSSFNKSIIWLQKYFEMECYHDSDMSHPLRSNSWKFIYTKHEYLIYLMRKNETKIY